MNNQNFDQTLQELNSIIYSMQQNDNGGSSQEHSNTYDHRSITPRIPNNPRKDRVRVTTDKLITIKNMLANNQEISIIAHTTELSISTIRKNQRKIELCEERNENIETICKKPGRKITLGESNISLSLPSIVHDDCSLTQRGMINKMVDMGLPSVAQSTVSRTLKKLSITRKRLKKRSARVFTPELINLRKQYAREIMQVPNGRIIYLDESGFNLHTGTNYGYSPANVDAIRSVPSNRGRNVSLIGLFSINGIISHRTINGAYNTIELLNFLKTSFDNNILGPNQIIILDNVRFHHSVDVRLWCEDKGIILKFLPPYSPSLNPIEEVFSLIKSRYSATRPFPNDNEDIHNYVDRVISEINDDENIIFENYYNNMRRYVDLAYNGEQF